MMLRINLIDRAALRRRRLVSVSKPLAVGAALAAGAWITAADAAARKTSRELAASLAAAETRLQRARSAPQDLDVPERSRALLEQRIAVLERAESRHGAAAAAVSAIASALPAGASLTEVRQEGELLTVRGRASGTADVAALAARLDAAAVFAAPVEITGTDAAADSGRGEGGTFITFVLVGKLHG